MRIVGYLGMEEDCSSLNLVTDSQKLDLKGCIPDLEGCIPEVHPLEHERCIPQVVERDIHILEVLPLERATAHQKVAIARDGPGQKLAKLPKQLEKLL